MPKETAHLSLAQALSGRLQEPSAFHGPVKKYPHLFLYGAVAPDTFYYDLAGPGSAFIQGQSKKFHTKNAGSLMPVLDFLNHFKTSDPGAMAFAAGICCHLMADTLFHPMVYYFCGIEGVHPGATARHRAFETAMDVYFLQNHYNNQPVNLGCILNKTAVPKPRLLDYLELLFNLKPGAWRTGLNRAIKSHQLAHCLFQKTMLGKIIRFFHYYGLGISSSYEALFYPVCTSIELSFFNNNVRYMDPATGKTIIERMEDLSEKTVQQTIILLSILESALISRQDLHKVLTHPDLPQISPGVEKNNFKSWYGKSNLNPVLYRELTNLLYGKTS